MSPPESEWIDGERSGEPNPGIGYTQMRGTIIRSPLTDFLTTG